MSDPILPPGAWGPAHSVARRLLSPIQRFLKVEAASGLGQRRLMTIFFFVVGLEIRREMHEGELSDLRRAALPLLAAVGGMLVPAAIYAAFNAGRAGSPGWGVPMATDIAFAVGVLTLLGRRVTPASRMLLLALAVIDDIGAILVIAIFYSAGISPEGFALVAGGIAGITLLKAIGVRGPAVYVLPGIVVWAGMLVAGVHPTLAGVILGLVTPVGTGPRAADDLEPESPATSLQHALHRWVAFVIMPLFAPANAGVEVGGVSLSGDASFVFLGILVGLGLASRSESSWRVASASARESRSARAMCPTVESRWSASWPASASRCRSSSRSSPFRPARCSRRQSSRSWSARSWPPSRGS